MSSALLGRKRREPALALGDRILDEAGDDPAGQFMDAARGLEPGISAVDLAEERVEERHLAKVLDGKEARPQAVVDVVGVIGDVVRDRRRLRLASGMSRKAEILQRVVFEDCERNAPRAHSARSARPVASMSGPLCLTRPSSVSQVRLRPS